MTGRDTEGEESTPEEFRIELNEPDDYTVYAASSARGGVQLSGDFLMEFFIERYREPQAEVFEITDNGALGEHLRNESRDSAVVRNKQAGIMMNQNNAFNLSIWIIANLLGDGVTETDVEKAIVSEFGDQLNK